MSAFLDSDDIRTEEGLQRFVDQIPYANFIGVRVRKIGGELTCTLPFHEDLVGNPMLPALHGGVVSALLETSAILQVIDEVASEHLPKPINVNINITPIQRRAVAATVLSVELGKRDIPGITGSDNWDEPGIGDELSGDDVDSEGGDEPV